MVIDFEERRKRRAADLVARAMKGTPRTREEWLAKNRLHRVKPPAKVIPLKPADPDTLGHDMAVALGTALADLKRTGYTFPGGLDKILQPDSE